MALQSPDLYLRKLSDQSNQQADEAKRSLVSIERNIKSTDDEFKKTADNFRQVATKAEGIHWVVSQVKNANEEDLRGTQEMLTAISSISDSSMAVKATYTSVNEKRQALRADFEQFQVFLRSSGESLAKVRGLSAEVNSSTKDLGIGNEEINKATQEVLTLTTKNSESIAALEAELSHFKLNEGAAASRPCRARGSRTAGGAGCAGSHRRGWPFGPLPERGDPDPPELQAAPHRRHRNREFARRVACLRGRSMRAGKMDLRGGEGLPSPFPELGGAAAATRGLPPID